MNHWSELDYYRINGKAGEVTYIVESRIGGEWEHNIINKSREVLRLARFDPRTESVAIIIVFDFINNKTLNKGDYVEFLPLNNIA